jgi:hypothetical protein
VRSAKRGTSTSAAEVANISARGVWVFLGDREIFIPFDLFPCLKAAPVGVIVNVKRPQPHHLYWPDLDVDIDLDSVEHPESYPLSSREASVVREKTGKKKSGR